MIARIEGILENILAGRALVRVGDGVVYELLVPAFTAARLGGSLGQRVSLYTLHFIEAQAQGATMLPRLAGFASYDDRRFFELFTTTKGIGYRKALRAMTLATHQIAQAIADRDVKLLQSLPEIGKRTAETLVVSLRDKVGAFTTPSAAGSIPPQAGSSDGETRVSGTHADRAISPSSPAVSTASGGGLVRDAVEVLAQLGENRAQVMAWIDQILSADEDDRPATVDALVKRVYQLKAGV